MQVGHDRANEYGQSQPPRQTHGSNLHKTVINQSHSPMLSIIPRLRSVRRRRSSNASSSLSISELWTRVSCSVTVEARPLGIVESVRSATAPMQIVPEFAVTPSVPRRDDVAADSFVLDFATPFRPLIHLPPKFRHVRALQNHPARAPQYPALGLARNLPQPVTPARTGAHKSRYPSPSHISQGQPSYSRPHGVSPPCLP